MGVPSDISHVMHPDGDSTPAMFVEVSADCKVGFATVLSQPHMHDAMARTADKH